MGIRNQLQQQPVLAERAKTLEILSPKGLQVKALKKKMAFAKALWVNFRNG
jgi:hypothetical protein